MFYSFKLHDSAYRGGYLVCPVVMGRRRFPRRHPRGIFWLLGGWLCFFRTVHPGFFFSYRGSQIFAGGRHSACPGRSRRRTPWGIFAGFPAFWPRSAPRGLAPPPWPLWRSPAWSGFFGIGRGRLTVGPCCLLCRSSRSIFLCDRSTVWSRPISRGFSCIIGRFWNFTIFSIRYWTNFVQLLFRVVPIVRVIFLWTWWTVWIWGRAVSPHSIFRILF